MIINRYYVNRSETIWVIVDRYQQKVVENHATRKEARKRCTSLNLPGLKGHAPSASAK